MIYKMIKEKMEEQLRLIPSIKSVDWYNEQYENTEKEQVEAYPAVYIEILDPVIWTDAAEKMQHGKMQVKLHVVVDTLSPGPELVMDIAQVVFLQINHKAFNNGFIEITSRWRRHSTQMVKRYRKLKVMRITFEAEVYDQTALDELTPMEDVVFQIPTS